MTWNAAATAPIERIARVLAGHELSRNGEGELESQPVIATSANRIEARLAIIGSLSTRQQVAENPVTLAGSGYDLHN